MVADIGAALSLYAVLVAIVLGATSLYRELELEDDLLPSWRGHSAVTST
ncbi:MAG: hypothetical protein U0235_19570 [Polyangiaceae bacterium]